MSIRRATLRATAILSSLLFWSVSACSARNDRGQTADSAVLSIGVAAAGGTKDPQIAGVRDLLSYEALVAVGTDGRAVPQLAERWERSADGLSWRFDLRKGVSFHDGAEVTAERVAELLMEAVSNPSTVSVAPSFQQVSSVTPDTETSFTIRLARPSALLLSDLFSVNITHGSGADAAGTGPFVLESRDDKRIVMRRFDRFREGVPTIERIELNPFPTVRNAWTALMRGEVDFLYEVGPDAAEFVQGESSVQTFTFLRPYSLVMGFNLSHPVLRSREVRQALNRAVDREAIVKQAFRGRGRPAQDPIWPNHWASSDTTPRYTHNPEAAVLGFAAAGYGKVRTGNGDMPSRFGFLCLVYPTLERVALIIQKQLFEIGVDMRIELADTAAMMGRLRSGGYDAFLFWQTSGRSLTWPYLFWHSPEPGRPGFMATGYSAADETLDRVRYARDDEEFRKAVSAFQEVVYNDPPAIFLAWEERMRAVSRKFDVHGQESGRDVTASLWRWRPAEAETARAR
jgi:peptide/nickel transport system substrate-binding protein